MPKVTYRATTRGGNFEPLQPPDNSDQILKQGERYIEGLKALRNAESARDAQFLRDFEATTNKGQQWKSDVDRERMRQAQAAADQKISQLKQQQAAAQAITGRKSSIQGIDSKTDKWVNFITGVSEVAGSMLGEYYEKQEAIWKQEGIAKAMLFPMNTDRLGFDRQFADLQIAGANQDTLAAYMEARGADPSEVHWMRTSNESQLSAYKHALAKRHGQTLGQQFLLDLQTNDQFRINVKQADGSTKAIPINQIDQNNLTQMSAAWMQYVPESFKNAGFGDANSEFITAGLEAAQQWHTQWSSTKMQEKISQATAQRLDQSRTVFGVNKDPKSWQAYYQTIYNNHPQAKGDPAKSRAEAFKALESPTISADEVAAIGRSTFYGQDKPLSEQYSAEWTAMLEARKVNEINAESRRVTQRKQEYGKLVEQLKAKANEDLAPDGDIDIANEELEQMIKQYENTPGAEAVVRQLQSMQKYTEENQRDQFFKDQWDAAILRGAPPSVEEVMSAEVSDKVKVAYKAKAVQEGAIAVPEALSKAAKNEIKQEIEQRVGWNINTNKARDPKIDRAINYALEQYKKDYRTARLTEDMSDAKAHDFALGKFQAALGTDKNKGIYAVGNTPDNMGGLVGFGREAVTEILDNPRLDIVKKLKELGPAAIDTPIVPKAQLEASIEKMKKTGMYDIPPQIQVMQNHLSGVSAVEILQRQINAHEDLDFELPQYITEIDQETQSMVGSYKDLLNKYPNTTRTDIAFIASGQEPIYQQASPLGEQVKAIFGKRESPQAGYDAINRGTGGDTPGGAAKRYGKPLTQMTLGEVKQLQAKELNAVGRYQFIESTLREAAADAGISDDMLFSEAVQDRIFFVHLDKYGAHQPWEQWWIKQGGPHLALTAKEKQLIQQFRTEYNPATPWRKAKNMNPAVVSKVGGIAPLDLAAMGTTATPIE